MAFDEINKPEKKDEHVQADPSKHPLNETLYSESESKESKLVFILEDFLPTMNLYKRILTGYKIRDAGTVDEAIKEIDKIKQSGLTVSVMISDFNLPDGISDRAIEHMKEVFPKVKVILISGNDDSKFLIKADKFISKNHIFEVKEIVDKFL